MEIIVETIIIMIEAIILVVVEAIEMAEVFVRQLKLTMVHYRLPSTMIRDRMIDLHFTMHEEQVIRFRQEDEAAPRHLKIAIDKMHHQVNRTFVSINQ